jgi:hypothetical protein
MFPLADLPTISVEGLLIVIWGGLWGGVKGIYHEDHGEHEEER